MGTRMEREGKEEKVGEANPPELVPFCFGFFFFFFWALGFPTKFYLCSPWDRGPEPKRRCWASWW